MNILIKIRELTNLTNSEKELANYILANPKKHYSLSQKSWLQLPSFLLQQSTA